MWSRPAPVPFQYSYWRSLRIPGSSKYEWPPGQMYCRLWEHIFQVILTTILEPFSILYYKWTQYELENLTYCWLSMIQLFEFCSFFFSFLFIYLFFSCFFRGPLTLQRVGTSCFLFFFVANNPARTREFSEGGKNARVEREEKRGCTWALRVQRVFRQSEEIISAVNKLFWYCKAISWILSISLRGLSFDVWY